MAAEVVLGPESFSVAALEMGPDDRGRRGDGTRASPAKFLGREEVLRREEAEPLAVDLADECPHGRI
jgi:hypothetical protein